MCSNTVFVDEDEVKDAIDQNLGWCCNCGEFTNSGVEPDAEGYECEMCGKNTVKGAEQALIDCCVEIE